jgi:hypothetical protein
MTKWTKSDLCFLYKNYKIRSISEIASNLKKEQNTVYGKLSRLKLRKKTPDWTIAEDNILRINYHHSSIPKLIKLIPNRTKSAIYTRAVILNLPRKQKTKNIVIDRFNLKFDINTKNDCWNWHAAKSDGYGLFYDGEKVVRAHRFSYQYFIGIIPDGLVLDHLCRNRLCVNPNHLEPVTVRKNILRGEGPTAKNAIKTHCPQGHEYNLKNTYYDGKGRMCKACWKLRSLNKYKSKHDLLILENLHRIKDRFLSRVNKGSIVNDCWEWNAGKSKGYGYFCIKNKQCRAHRVSYILFKGLPGESNVIDHLCRNTLCVNPLHLEAIPNSKNVSRGMSQAGISMRSNYSKIQKNRREFYEKNKLL